MNIEPIAYFHGPMPSKFGIPRQGGLVKSLPGRIVFEPAYRSPDAVRGLKGFDFLWIIWGFSANSPHMGTTVRPPRLGGNERIGVFASRSPFRPNGLGLTCVYINKVEMSSSLGPVIHVMGADLMDGTPIYDVKPYVAYADAHADARCGFVDDTQWDTLDVVIPDGVTVPFGSDELMALREVLAQDPRPRYHEDPERIYGMPFAGYDVRFKVSDGVLRVVEISKLL